MQSSVKQESLTSIEHKAVCNSDSQNQGVGGEK